MTEEKDNVVQFRPFRKRSDLPGHGSQCTICASVDVTFTGIWPVPEDFKAWDPDQVTGVISFCDVCKQSIKRVARYMDRSTGED